MKRSVNLRVFPAAMALIALVGCPNLMGPVAMLPAPTGITVVPSSATSVRVSWSPVTGADGYNIYRSYAQAGQFLRINIEPVHDLQYEDGGPPSNIDLWYRVAATRGGEEQTLSEAYACSLVLLGAPANGKVTYLTDTSLRVSWDALTAAGGYNVYRSTSLYGTYSLVNVELVTGTSYDDSGLSQATEYWYTVAAVSNGIEQTRCSPLSGYTGQRWARSYGGGAVRSIQQTADGGYLAAGSTTAFGAGGKDVSVLKLAADGSVSWHRTYGGSADDMAYSARQTADGDISLPAAQPHPAPGVLISGR